MLPNYLADKMGVINVLIFVSFSTGVLTFALFGVTTTGGVIVFAILYGFFSGSCQSPPFFLSYVQTLKARSLVAPCADYGVPVSRRE
jgi:hypothetical protein